MWRVKQTHPKFDQMIMQVEWVGGLATGGPFRRQPAVNQWRHLDFEGRDPTVVLLSPAEPAAPVPECTCGIPFVFVWVLIPEKQALS